MYEALAGGEGQNPNTPLEALYGPLSFLASAKAKLPESNCKSSWKTSLTKWGSMNLSSTSLSLRSQGLCLSAGAGDLDFRVVDDCKQYLTYTKTKFTHLGFIHHHVLADAIHAVIYLDIDRAILELYL